jgi:cyclase
MQHTSSLRSVDGRCIPGSGRNAYLAQLEEGLKQQTDPEQLHTEGSRLARLRAYWRMLPSFELVMSHVTFMDRLSLHGTKPSVELITFGGGHSDSDSFLYLPAGRIAFMGDLLFVHHQPWLGDGHPEQWVRIIEQVRTMAIDTLVPGHGQPGTMADAEMIQAYIEAVLGIAAEPAAHGGEVVLPAQFDGWDAEQLMAANRNFLRTRVAAV